MVIIRVISKFLLAAGCSLLIGAAFTLYATGFISPAMASLEEVGSTIASDFQERFPEAFEKSANPFTMKRWSPYAAGAGIGVLSWLAFLLSNHPLGVSTAIAKTSGMARKALGKENAAKTDYFKKFPPQIDWEWVLVAGLLTGAFLSAILSGDFRIESVPAMWEGMFGDSAPLRILVAFIGGMVMIIGARWAGGCTSGHGISGALQMAASGWLALVSFFFSGIVTAYIIYGLS